MSIYNLTPHPVTIVLGNDKEYTIKSSGELRLASETPPVPGLPYLTVTGPQEEVRIPVVRSQQITGLLETSPGYAIAVQEATSQDAIIVSAMTARYLQENPTLTRARLFVPASGPGMSVRDATGNIKGVKALEYFEKV